MSGIRFKSRAGQECDRMAKQSGKTANKEDVGKTNETEHMANIDPATVQAVVNQLKAQGLIKEPKKRAPRYNVAVEIKTDRGGDYLKSARHSEDLVFLGGDKKNPVVIGELKYSVDGNKYTLVASVDGEETVIFEKEI